MFFLINSNMRFKFAAVLLTVSLLPVVLISGAPFDPPMPGRDSNSIPDISSKSFSSTYDDSTADMVRCYCNMPECLAATGGVQTCITRMGCFSEIQPMLQGSKNVVPPVTQEAATIMPPILPEYDEEAAVRSIVGNDNVLNGEYGCLELLPVKRTCDEILKSMEGDNSELPILHIPQKKKKSIPETASAYLCCNDHMCNDRLHVAATLRNAREILLVAMNNSMMQQPEYRVPRQLDQMPDQFTTETILTPRDSLLEIVKINDDRYDADAKDTTSVNLKLPQEQNDKINESTKTSVDLMVNSTNNLQVSTPAADFKNSTMPQHQDKTTYEPKKFSDYLYSTPPIPNHIEAMQKLLTMLMSPKKTDDVISYHKSSSDKPIVDKVITSSSPLPVAAALVNVDVSYSSHAKDAIVADFMKPMMALQQINQQKDEAVDQTDLIPANPEVYKDTIPPTHLPVVTIFVDGDGPYSVQTFSSHNEGMSDVNTANSSPTMELQKTNKNNTIISGMDNTVTEENLMASSNGTNAPNNVVNRSNVTTSDDFDSDHKIISENDKSTINNFSAIYVTPWEYSGSSGTENVTPKENSNTSSIFTVKYVASFENSSESSDLVSKYVTPMENSSTSSGLFMEVTTLENSRITFQEATINETPLVITEVDGTVTKALENSSIANNDLMTSENSSSPIGLTIEYVTPTENSSVSGSMAVNYVTPVENSSTSGDLIMELTTVENTRITFDKATVNGTLSEVSRMDDNVTKAFENSSATNDMTTSGNNSGTAANGSALVNITMTGNVSSASIDTITLDNVKDANAQAILTKPNVDKIATDSSIIDVTTTNPEQSVETTKATQTTVNNENIASEKNMSLVHPSESVPIVDSLFSDITTETGKISNMEGLLGKFSDGGQQAGQLPHLIIKRHDNFKGMEKTTKVESTSMSQEMVSSTFQTSEPSVHNPSELPAGKGPQGTMGESNTRPNKQSDLNNEGSTTVYESNTNWTLKDWAIGLAGVCTILVMIKITIIILSHIKIESKPDVLNNIKVDTECGNSAQPCSCNGGNGRQRPGPSEASFNTTSIHRGPGFGYNIPGNRNSTEELSYIDSTGDPTYVYTPIPVQRLSPASARR